MKNISILFETKDFTFANRGVVVKRPREVVPVAGGRQLAGAVVQTLGGGGASESADFSFFFFVSLPCSSEQQEICSLRTTELFLSHCFAALSNCIKIKEAIIFLLLTRLGPLRIWRMSVQRPGCSS